jgi:mevalonate kinase
MQNNTVITVSAPGKLLLMGEHAVVYGYPSIVTAVNERLYISIEKTDDGKITIEAPQVKDTRFVDAAIAASARSWNISPAGFRLTSESRFSGVYGFGSSSAVTVATLKAMAVLYEISVDNKALFDVALEVVRSVQGKASGVDVAAAIFGGTLLYGDGGNILEQLEDVRIPLIVGYTGVKADTVTLVDQVAQKREQQAVKVDRVFAAIETLTRDAKLKIQEGDWERVGKLMDFNQEYLRDLGVSSEKLETLIHAAKQAGAWGAKLSGAGGGDCMIAIASEEHRAEVVHAIQQASGEVVDIRAGAEGVRVETTDDQQELCIVVDTNDNILGYKTRYECHHNPTLLHRTVGAIIYNEKGEVLLQKRSMTKDMDPGLWGISCAGHVTKGQSDDEAIHRELKEELDIDTPLTALGSYIIGDAKESERAALYKGIHNGPFNPNTLEVSELSFMNPQILQENVNLKRIALTKAALAAFKLVGVLS